jgi:hypothetical protein
LASGQSDVRALFCEQVSDSRIRPTGCLFVYYFFEWVLFCATHRKAAAKIKNPRERQSSRGLMVGPVGFEPTTKGL